MHHSRGKDELTSTIHDETEDESTDEMASMTDTDSEEENMSDEGAEEADDENQEDTDGSDSEEDESLDEDEEQDFIDTVLAEMMDKAFKVHRNEEKAIATELVEMGVDVKDANARAHEQLLPKFQKTFRRLYKDEVIKLQKLRRHSLYKKVMQKAHELEENGFDQDEAIAAAVSYRKHLLNKIVSGIVPQLASESDD